MLSLAASLTDLWISYFVGWGGLAGFTLGMVGAAVAVVLRFAGFRRVREAPDPIEWFGLWSFLGGAVGAAAGVVIWVNNLE
jgi:hypothetical protein